VFKLPAGEEVASVYAALLAAELAPLKELVEAARKAGDEADCDCYSRFMCTPCRIRICLARLDAAPTEQEES
jgi:ferredoxin